MSIQYDGWRKESQGNYMGLSLPQLLIVAVAGLPVLAAMSVQRWIFVLAYAPFMALVMAVTIIPIHGRPLARWLWDGATFQVARQKGWSAFRSKAATGAASPKELAEADLPNIARALRFHSGPPFGQFSTRVCIIQDPHAGRWTVTGRLSHPGIMTQDAEVKDAYAQGLSALLAALSQGETVARLSLYVRTVPDDGAERHMWVGEHADPAASEVLTEINRDIESRILAVSVRQDYFVSVSVDEDKIRSQAREQGGGVTGRAIVLYRVLAEVEERLLSAGASGIDWMDSEQLASVIRTGFNPAAGGGIEHARLRRARGQAISTGTLLGAAGPSLAPPPKARSYLHDGFVSISYALLLPERSTTVGKLTALLTPSSPGERRCLALHYEPLTPRAGRRAVESSAFGAEISHDLRQAQGRRIRSGDHRRKNAASVHELDLDNGHQIARSAGVITVTSPADGPSEDHAAHAEADARGSGFQLLRLELAQDSAFTAGVLPLGIGLPDRKALR